MPVQCPVCNTSFPDGTFIYGGPATRSKKGLDISGKVTREALFAGGDFANIQSTFKHKAVGIGASSAVKIHVANDNVTLDGYFHTATNQVYNRTILVLSGSGNTMATYGQEIISGYLRMGVNVLAMDYRGFAGNTGIPSSRGTYTDAEAMLAYLTSPLAQNGRNIQIGEIIVHGYSLGSGPAVELARHHGALAGLVLHCPMSSAAENAKLAMGGGIKGFIAARITACGHGYNNLSKIGEVRCPVHIITGSTDDMKPQGLALYKRLGHLKSKHEYTGGHLDRNKIFASGDLEIFVQST